MISTASENSDRTSSSKSRERKKDRPRWLTSLRIWLVRTEMSRLLPPCCPFSCSNTMLGTRPTFRSFSAMFFPDLARGIARIVSSCFGSGRGNPGRYSSGAERSPMGGSPLRSAAAACENDRRLGRILSVLEDRRSDIAGKRPRWRCGGGGAERRRREWSERLWREELGFHLEIETILAVGCWMNGRTVWSEALTLRWWTKCLKIRTSD